MNACVEVRSYGHVTAILEVETFEIKTVVSLLISVSSVVELHQVLRSLVSTWSSKAEVNAVHVSAKGSYVVVVECLTAYATSLRSIEVGSGSHDDVSPFSVFDEDAFVGSRYRSTLVGYYLKGRAILNRSHAAIE